MTVTPPRPGAAGLYDRLVGPGATTFEEAGAWAFASLGAIVGGLAPRTARERLLGAVLGFDAGGGLWVNESRAGKRWYRRAGAPRWEPVAFAALHLHPFVVEAASGRRDWRRAAVTWALPVAGTAAVVVADGRGADARAVAGSFAGTGAALGAMLAPPGWRWLAPVLAFKLVTGHGTADGPLARLVDRVEGSGA